MLPREEAVALVRRLIDAAHRGDLALFASVYADDAVMVSPVFGVVTGRDRIVATWKQLLSTFSELAIEVADILIDGDRIAVLSSVSTMDRAGWFGLAPTGGPIGYRLVLLLTVRGGAIVRDERIYDSAGIVERLEKARLDKELRMAADVQHALLGRKAHAGGFCESVGDSIPCRAIGGDFFEFLQLPSNRIGIAMGDVSGKGPAAALLAAMIQGMLAAESSAGDGPAQTMTRLNRRLAARRLDARFATLVYAVLSPGARARHGRRHPPPDGRRTDPGSVSRGRVRGGGAAPRPAGHARHVHGRRD